MYEEDARAFAVALYLDHGFSYDEIAFLLRDSRKFMGDRPSGGGGNSQGPVASTIQEWVRLFLDTGDVMPRDANAEGCPVFTVAEEQALKAMVDADPTVMLDELVYHMYYRTGKFVDVSTMCRLLARLGYTNRNVRERMLRGPAFAAGIGRQEQAFVTFQQRHFAHEMVFFDESAAVERKLARRRGWGVKGDELFSYVPHPMRRSERYTLAASMSVNGRGVTAVCKGSLNRDRFLEFMRRLLPTMNRHWDAHGNRTHLPQSVLVLDNCATHRCQEFYALARDHGVKLSFTPPYMPWYRADGMRRALVHGNPICTRVDTSRETVLLSCPSLNGISRAFPLMAWSWCPTSTWMETESSANSTIFFQPETSFSSSSSSSSDLCSVPKSSDSKASLFARLTSRTLHTTIKTAWRRTAGTCFKPGHRSSSSSSLPSSSLLLPPRGVEPMS